jgi:putative transcriptional regulator
MDGSVKGRLLVANPALRDPNFDRTVVFVLEHSDEGAVGVVLNRPSETPLDELLPAWARRAAEPAVAFVGGPVGAGGAIGVSVGADGLDVVDLYGEPDGLPPGAVIRVFVGYAGWAPRQLEGELEAGGWFVVDAAPDDVIASRATTLWRDVLRRQRGGLALVAAYPSDPTLN